MNMRRIDDEGERRITAEELAALAPGYAAITWDDEERRSPARWPWLVGALIAAGALLAQGCDKPTDKPNPLATTSTPWTPGGAPMHLVLADLEPGIYHAFAPPDTLPFLWGENTGLAGGLVDLAAMTGAPEHETPITIEIRRTR